MKKRLTSLDAVRTFACLGVMAFHMHLCTFGHLGVSVFFVMSGFLSGYNHLESMDTGHITLGGSARFAYRKIIKLYPLYLIMLVIPAAGELYGVVNGMASLPTMLGKLAANVLLVQAWIPLNEYYFSYNGPAWYLSSAAFAYFMLPLVLRGVKRCRARRGREPCARLFHVVHVCVPGIPAWGFRGGLPDGKAVPHAAGECWRSSARHGGGGGRDRAHSPRGAEL